MTTPVLAATPWPDAAIAIAGIIFVTVIISVAIWQVFATGRTGIKGSAESGYRKLVETSEAQQLQTNELLERMADDLSDLRGRVGELERMLREVG